MKKNYIGISILINFLFSQIVPFESTSIQTDILIDKSNQAVRITEGNSNIKLDADNFRNDFSSDRKYMEILLELSESKTIKLEMLVDGIDKSTSFFLIDADDSDVVGPFYKNSENASIVLGPIQATRFVLQCILPQEIDLTEIEFTIQEIHNLNSTKRVHKNNYFRKKETRENPIIVVTGFWPPTNEMIRHFSQDPNLNSDGWQGEDWNGLGYDIISFFPEFEVPDCSSCGQGYGDFEVDYQDTSSDFWLLVDALDPIAVITFSRGYMDNSWELEYNYYNRTNWVNDYTAPFSPTPNPPDSDEPSFFLRNSTLPMESIMETVNSAHLGLNSYIDWNGDPGHFVSEFMGYHGVWYHGLNQFEDAPCYLAGHVHVGGLIDWDIATQAAEITIAEVIDDLESFIYTPGDVNADENIDVLDLVTVVSYILGVEELPGSSYYAADMNSDGIINIQDVILILNLIL